MQISANVWKKNENIDHTYIDILLQFCLCTRSYNDPFLYE